LEQLLLNRQKNYTLYLLISKNNSIKSWIVIGSSDPENPLAIARIAAVQILFTQHDMHINVPQPLANKLVVWLEFPLDMDENSA
jgi:hypothetical protein